MHPAIRGWREAQEQLRLNKIYRGLRVSDDRPRYIFHGNLSLVDFRKNFRDRKTIAMFPPLSGNRRNGIKIPGLKTLYRPIMGGSPATYFVKNGGNDELAGTSDELAWATLSKALTGPYYGGDIIQFKRGSTWTEATWWVPPSSGSEENPITFKDYDSGAIPEFKNTYTEWDYMHLSGKSWIDFENLNINGNGQANCEVICYIDNSNHINFTNVELHNNGKNGQIVLICSTNGSVSYIDFESCILHDTNGSTLGEAFYVNSTHASNTISYITLNECELYDCFEGIHWRVGTGNTALANGTFTNNEIHSLESHLADTDVLVECDADCTDTIFAYNYFHDCGQSSNHWVLVQISGGAGSSTIQFYYNIFDTCKVANTTDGAVFNAYDVPGGFGLFNNNAYNIVSAGADYNGIVLDGTTDYVEAKNNAFHTFVNHVRNKQSAANCDFDYNCRYGGTQGDLTGANDVTSDPLWLGAASGNFRLASNSPCIEAGTPIAGLTRDYYGVPLGRGTNPDIGASETLKGGPRRL